MRSPTCRSRHPGAAVVVGLLMLLTGTAGAEGPPEEIGRFFRPPPEFQGDFGPYKSPLKFADGRTARDATQWRERRQEILTTWRSYLGTWPPLLEGPGIEELETARREDFTQRRVRLRVAPDRTTEGYLLVPDGPGPFPAVLVVYYEPETAIGRGKERLDFAYQLARRGFLSLSIGFDPRGIDTARSGLELQPLSYLAYVAANAYGALAALPQLDPKRVGVMGHSYGGKWAMFASCLCEEFACGVWCDPGIVFDETRPNVNYWEPYYLGWEPDRTRRPGVPTADNPRTGPYRRLVEAGHDLHELHALMAPRPFLVSGGSEDPPGRWKALNHAVAVNRLLGQADRVAMTNREGHAPTAESNEQIYRFLDYVLKPPPPAGDAKDRR